MVTAVVIHQVDTQGHVLVEDIEWAVLAGDIQDRVQEVATVVRQVRLMAVMDSEEVPEDHRRHHGDGAMAIVRSIEDIMEAADTIEVVGVRVFLRVS